ncbi:DUF4097 family beta strand repeat-containing protein [Candidatus Enterococcus mansonii]|uniref:DUF4097 domain-containing protein n=1 Tax=Candidatus Enterococcus mansonii TaxID=1834181 RepID=A0A242CGI8_9ENTE|nr:DUF4097 family beta strand repeat-containing protein [Enterococcus sp. 4G2_DIV0659]OTO09364.1 hypothetical protein A5880_000043 [Enterococcus sp. 4G2_DIV0659]
MKKTTAFFLSVAIICMIIGGIGSATFFRRAEQSMTKQTMKTYDIKDKKNTKEIHLNLSGNADFYILTESSNKVVMNTRSSKPISIESSLDVKEKNDQLTISANSNRKKMELDGLKFDIFDRGSAVNLTIPDTVERLIIDGKSSGDIHLSNVTTKKIDVAMNNADVNANTINTEKLTIETQNGDIHVKNDIRADEATFKTANGDIQINNFTSSDWSVYSSSGDISLYTVKGTSKIETVNGDIEANNLKGDVSVKSVNGQFSLSGTDMPKKLSVESQQGDIQLNTEEILYDVSIKTKTTLGDSTIFGKERSSYKKGKEKKSFELKSNSGDISVDGPSDGDDD